MKTKVYLILVICIFLSIQSFADWGNSYVFPFTDPADCESLKLEAQQFIYSLERDMINNLDCQTGTPNSCLREEYNIASSLLVEAASLQSTVSQSESGEVRALSGVVNNINYDANRLYTEVRVNGTSANNLFEKLYILHKNIQDVECTQCTTNSNDNCCSDILTKLDTIITDLETSQTELEEISSSASNLVQELQHLEEEFFKAYFSFWTSSVVTNGFAAIAQYLPTILTNEYFRYFFYPDNLRKYANGYSTQFTMYPFHVYTPQDGHAIQTGAKIYGNLWGLFRSIFALTQTTATSANIDYENYDKILHSFNNIQSTTTYLPGWDDYNDNTTNRNAQALSIPEISSDNDFYAATVGYLRNLESLSKQTTKSVFKIFENTSHENTQSKLNSFSNEFEEAQFELKEDQIKNTFDESKIKRITTELYYDEQTLAQKFNSRLPNLEANSAPQHFSFIIPKYEAESTSSNFVVEAEMSEYSWFFDLIRAFFRLLWWSASLYVLIFVWGYLVTFIKWIWKLLTSINIT